MDQVVSEDCFLVLSNETIPTRAKNTAGFNPQALIGSRDALIGRLVCAGWHLKTLLDLEISSIGDLISKTLGKGRKFLKQEVTAYQSQLEKLPYLNITVFFRNTNGEKLFSDDILGHSDQAAAMDFISARNLFIEVLICNGFKLPRICKLTIQELSQLQLNPDASTLKTLYLNFFAKLPHLNSSDPKSLAFPAVNGAPLINDQIIKP